MPFWSSVSPAPGATLYIAEEDERICRISFAGDPPPTGWVREDGRPLIREAARQLTLYFERRLRDFDLPLVLLGTPFQRRVWDELLRIPYGATISYAELAARVGSPKAFRAAGAANGQNPIPIVVPCHRVINSGGGLGGYSCGIEYKRRLLSLESEQASFATT
jgi:methylated-DNA-[protein]-cysteine S-methyltransferase